MWLWTRAQKQLFLSEAGGITNGANNDSAGKQKQARVPSRFLFELEEGDYLEVGTCALSGQSLAQIKAQQQRLQCDIADLLSQMQESGGRALLNENVFAGSDLDKDKESGQKSSKWQVGDRVFHKILGAGTVRELHEDAAAPQPAAAIAQPAGSQATTASQPAGQQADAPLSWLQRKILGSRHGMDDAGRK